jgi:hypothetical protein
MAAKGIIMVAIILILFIIAVYIYMDFTDDRNDETDVFEDPELTDVDRLHSMNRKIKVLLRNVDTDQLTNNEVETFNICRERAVTVFEKSKEDNTAEQTSSLLANTYVLMYSLSRLVEPDA